MTKAKCLVTVMVDSVFVQFPIDDERYELITAVGRAWHNRKVGQRSILPSGSAHINMTVASIEETLQRGSRALMTESFHGSSAIMSRLDRDRSRRTYASIDRTIYRDAIRRPTVDKASAFLTTALFGILYERLLVVNATSTMSLKDKGVPI